MGEHRIYIKGLSEKVTEEDLKELFRECGFIRSIKTGSSDFAFVEFENSADAEAAVKSFNGYEYNSKILQVEIAQIKSDNEGDEDGGRNLGSHSPDRRSHDKLDDGKMRSGDGGYGGYRNYNDRGFDNNGCFNCKQFGHFARDCKEKPRNPNFLDTKGTRVGSIRDPNRNIRPDPYRRPSTQTTDYRDLRGPTSYDHDFRRRRSPERDWRDRDGRVDLRDEVNRRVSDPYISRGRDYVDDYPAYIDRRYDSGLSSRDYEESRFAPRGGRPRDIGYEPQFYGREIDPRGNIGDYYEPRPSSGPSFRGGRNDIEPRGRGSYYDEFGGRDHRPEPVYGGHPELDLRDSIHYQNPRLGYNDGGGRYQR